MGLGADLVKVSSEKFDSNNIDYEMLTLQFYSDSQTLNHLLDLTAILEGSVYSFQCLSDCVSPPPLPTDTGSW